MKDHRSYALNWSSWEIERVRPKKYSGLNGIRTYDRCDTSAAFLPTELSSQLGAGHIASS